MWGLRHLSPREALEAVGAALRAHRRLIVAFGLVAFVGTLALNAAAHYTARTVISFAPLNQSRVLSDVGVPAPAPPTAAELTSAGILQRMIDEQLAARPETIGTLQDKLHVEGYSDGEGTLAADGDTEQDAVNLAVGWVAALQRTRADDLDAQFRAAESALRDELSRPSRRGEALTALDRRDLRRQIARLHEASRALPQEVRVVQGATAVRGAGIHNELAIALAALLVGALVAILLELRSGRLRTPAAAGASFGAPVLGGAAPDAGLGIRGVAARLDARAASKNGAGPPATVLITPSAEVERPYEAGLALARAYEEEGRSTALVLWRVDAPADTGGVRVVTESRPAHELGTRLPELRWDADRIVVLGPAVSREPGALVVATLVDLWLVVVALGRTREREARTLMDALQGFEHPPDGVVLAP